MVRLGAARDVGEVTSLTFCDGEGDKGFTALTKVGSRIAYEAVMDPDPIRFISRCVTYIAGRQDANVPETSVGLSMPVSGFTKPDTFDIVLTLSYAVVQVTSMGNEVNVRIKIATSLTYGSGSMA